MESPLDLPVTGEDFRRAASLATLRLCERVLTFAILSTDQPVRFDAPAGDEPSPPTNLPALREEVGYFHNLLRDVMTGEVASVLPAPIVPATQLLSMKMLVASSHGALAAGDWPSVGRGLLASIGLLSAVRPLPGAVSEVERAMWDAAERFYYTLVTMGATVTRASEDDLPKVEETFRDVQRRVEAIFEKIHVFRTEGLVTLWVQVNGKEVGTIRVRPEATPPSIEEAARALPAMQMLLRNASSKHPTITPGEGIAFRTVLR